MATKDTNVNKPNSSASSTGAVGSVMPTVFLPPSDTSAGTWLSLGSYEEVFNSDWDYWAINKELAKSGMVLEKILKIHNNHLKDAFEKEVELLKKNKGTAYIPNIEDLFHGSSSSLDQICQEGLDERIGTKGHFGKGIYFSDNPQLCRIHSESKNSSQHFIIRCKVILGDCKVYDDGKSDPSLTREPVKTLREGKNIFFDSVKGKPGKYNEYVIYDKRHALIQYVIYYSTTDPLPDVPSIPSSQKSTKSSTKSHGSKTNIPSNLSSSPTGAPANRSRSVSPVDVRPRERRPSVSSTNSNDSRGPSPDRDSTSDRGSGAYSTDDDDDKKKISLGGAAADYRFVDSSVSTKQTTNAATTSSGESVSGVTRVQSRRKRTERLMNQVTEETTGVYKKELQDEALKHMLDLKGKVTSTDMDELWKCFRNTYGGAAGGSDASTEPGQQNASGLQDLQPSDQFRMDRLGIYDDDDEIQTVIDVLVEEFMKVAGEGVGHGLARQYIVQHEMDVNQALEAYFNENF